MSELTVPRAPALVGRTANVDTTPVAGALAGAIGDFGETILRHGMALEADRLDRQMSRRQVDITRDLGELRLQVEDMGDPDAAGAAWDQGFAAIREKYLDGADENGRPLVDKRNTENFNLAFDDLGNQHALAIGGRLLSLRQSQRAATYYEYGQVAGAEAARTDPETRAALYANFDAETDKQIAAGTMTPEAGAKAKVEFRQSTENAAAIEASAADPAGFLDALDGEGFAHLDAETKARWRVSAQAELARRAAAEVKAADTASKERAAVVKADIEGMINIWGAGQTPANAARLETPEYKDHPLWAEAKAAEALAIEIPGIRQMTPAQLDAQIQVEAAKPKEAPWQTERLKVLKDTREKVAAAYKSDPIAAARTAELAVPALPDDLLADPAATAAALAARVTFAGGLVEQGYTRSAAYLDAEENAALKAALSADADPAQRVALAGAIVGAVRSRGGDPSKIDALEADPVLAWTAGMVAGGAGSTRLATEILSGEQAMEAKNLILPPLADRLSPTFDQVGTLFADVPGGEALQGQAVAAADALYAARIRRIDPTGEIDEDLWNQALHEVLGGTGAYGSSAARGGVQDVRGRQTMVDPGVSAQEMTEAFDALLFQMNSEEFGYAMSDEMRDLHRWPDSTASALTTASRSGGLPAIGGTVLKEDDLDGATFQAVGRDAYVLVLDQGNGTLATDSKTGNAFVFSFARLMQEYGQ
jgi:hypothetical protein